MDNTIYSEIQTERNQQDVRYGGAEHDDTHSKDDWASFIQEHNDRAFNETGADRRYELIRVAALAVAAIESHDRIYK